MTEQTWTSQIEPYMLLRAYRNPIRFFRGVDTGQSVRRSLSILLLVSFLVTIPQLLSGTPLAFLFVTPLLTILMALLNSFVLDLSRSFVGTEARFSNFLSFSSSVSVFLAPIFVIPIMRKVAALIFIIFFWTGIYMRFNPQPARLVLLALGVSSISIPIGLLVGYGVFLSMI